MGTVLFLILFLGVGHLFLSKSIEELEREEYENENKRKEQRNEKPVL